MFFVGMDAFKGFAAQFLRDALQRFSKIGFTGGKVVAVRAEQMDLIFLQQAHRPGCGTALQEELRIRLHHHGQLRQLLAGLSAAGGA